MPYSIPEYLLFVLLGITTGLIGAGFIVTVEYLHKVKQGFKLLRSNYVPVMGVAFLGAALAFALDPFLKASHYEAVALFFSSGPIDYVNRPLLHLFLFIVSKFILTCLAIMLPVCR